jgi:hypothetical protein
MAARALGKWAMAFPRDEREAHPQKKEGRHFPLGSPPAPQIPPARVRMWAGSPL